MEDVLAAYKLPYNALRPVICFDERPCFLIGDIVSPLNISHTNAVKKEHYAYEKLGSCCLMVAIEPLTGKRFAKVYARRTQKEYTGFMQYVSEQYPDVEAITLVQDNLNTHRPSSFYKNLEAPEAFKLTKRFDWHYTPKSASWLNMVEIELSAISRQCLNRRIPKQELLEEVITEIVKERNDKQIKINWQFSIEDARDKLNRHYETVNSTNKKSTII